jgi:hypothetical protein
MGDLVGDLLGGLVGNLLDDFVVTSDGIKERRNPSELWGPLYFEIEAGSSEENFLA